MLFQRLLVISEDRFEAEKGLAFAALWSGQLGLSVTRFEALVAEYPDRPDALAGLAQAYLALGHPRQALEVAERTERIAPGRPDVAGVRSSAARTPAPLELMITAGHTRFAGSQPSSGLSLRSVDVAVRPAADLTLYGQYDDGISVDTRALALGGGRAPTYRGTVAVTWADRMVTRAGYGRRSLPDGTHQRLTEVDQAIVLGRVALSAGWSDVNHPAGSDERALRTGILFAPMQSWEFGLTGHVRTIDAGPSGNTVVVTATYKFTRPVDVLAGVAFGKDPGIAALPQREAFLHVSARPWDGNGFSVTLRRQFGPRPDRLTVFAAGIVVGVGRG